MLVPAFGNLTTRADHDSGLLSCLGTRFPSLEDGVREEKLGTDINPNFSFYVTVHLFYCN